MFHLTLVLRFTDTLKRSQGDYRQEHRGTHKLYNKVFAKIQDFKREIFGGKFDVSLFFNIFFVCRGAHSFFPRINQTILPICI